MRAGEGEEGGEGQENTRAFALSGGGGRARGWISRAGRVSSEGSGGGGSGKAEELAE